MDEDTLWVKNFGVGWLGTLIVRGSAQFIWRSARHCIMDQAKQYISKHFASKLMAQ